MKKPHPCGSYRVGDTKCRSRFPSCSNVDWGCGHQIMFVQQTGRKKYKRFEEKSLKKSETLW